MTITSTQIIAMDLEMNIDANTPTDKQMATRGTKRKAPSSTKTPSSDEKEENPAKKRVFVCHICDRKMTQSINLKKHLLVHEGKRPNKCKKCKLSFTDKSNLTRHMKIHSGEKPFRCEDCNKTCNRKSNLKIHYESLKHKKKVAQKIADEEAQKFADSVLN